MKRGGRQKLLIAGKFWIIAICNRMQRGRRVAEIELRNISKRSGNFVGVRNFDLTIADREFYVLLGLLGCGKTTTMRMIAGLEEASEGDNVIDGRRVNGLDPKDRDITMFFQSYALYPNMDIYENIRFPLKVRKVPKAEHDARVRRASAMVELDDFLHRKPGELLGGQRQRVALARAVVREPEDVGLCDAGGANITAPIYSLELLGDATMVSVKAGGTLVSVKAPKDYRAEIGEVVHACVPVSICHLFDIETGERID